MTMERNWEKDLEEFKDFLEGIDLKKYSNLRQIKTVEQDLPRELLPLEIYYRHYWHETDFKDFDEIFTIYWKEKCKHIYDFIKKYFYGCSLQFVEEGFKARLFRIWMSILTQFHFQYLWNALFDEKIQSSEEIDMKGVDGIVELGGVKVGIQIKKVSYRREASSRIFTKKQPEDVDVLVEVPYLVINIDEIIRKINSSRVKEDKKDEYKNILQTFEENFNKLPNGFVIFKSDYLKRIKEKIDSELESYQKDEKIIITYDQILEIKNIEKEEDSNVQRDKN